MENYPRLDLERMKDYQLCFGCGKQNPIGLHLNFTKNDHGVQARFTPDKNLQGWGGFLHGGIIACALDEAIGQAVMILSGAYNVTAKMQVRYRKMAPIDDTYTLTGDITKQTSRLIETEAKLLANDGSIVAEATSTQFIVNPAEPKSK
jgi:acyl-coenzyme A thioesterase PaaI-like protein